MFVSVLIPTVDRAPALLRCLDSVLQSDYADFEVIVLDQNESTSELPITDPRVQHVRLGSRGKSRALNAGLALAQGSIIALTDDDMEVDPSWLSGGMKAILKSPY